MNGTTDPAPRQEFSPSYLRGLYSLTIVVLLVVFFVQPEFKSSFLNGTSILMPPSVTAAGVVVSNGITEFNSTELTPIENGSRITAAASLLLMFIVVPTIIVFHLVSGPSPERSWRKPFRTILFTMALFFGGLSLIAVTGGAVQSSRIFASMQRSNDISEERDVLTNELSLVYAGITSHYYAAGLSGHGGHENLALHDLGVTDRVSRGTLHLDPSSVDTMFIVRAVGTIIQEGNTFRNCNNETGRIQYRIEVHPSVPMYTIHKEN